MALDNCGSYIITGSRDCTCIIWSLNNANIKATTSSSKSTNTNSNQIIGLNHHQMNVAMNPTIFNNIPKPLHTLYGHENAVSCVAIMTELDLVVSGSKVIFLIFITNTSFYKL